MDYLAHFKKYYPQPTDFKAEEYEANKEAIDSAAQAAGYKYVGERIKRAVFSSKL